MILRSLFLFLVVVHFITPVFAGDDVSDDGCIVALDDEAERSTIHPLARRIFLRSEREKALAEIQLDPSQFASWFPDQMKEHEMVKLAIEKVTAPAEFSAYQRAVLWEELSAVIHKKIKQPITQGYWGVHVEDVAYIFQGRKRFDGGKTYVLILLENGKIYTGLHEPIDKTAEWLGRLDQLKLVKH